jgi:hypothetical protein
VDTATLLPLDKMTVEQKLRVMEEIWADLRKNEDNIPVPDWHKELLADREKKITEGKAKFTDWETVKRRLTERFSLDER